MYKHILALLVVTLLAAPAVAQNQVAPPATITVVGCQNGVGCYLQTSPVPPTNCLYNLIYIPLDNTGYGQGTYATAVLAFTTGKNVTIPYLQPGGNGTTCTALLVQVSN